MIPSSFELVAAPVDLRDFVDRFDPDTTVPTITVGTGRTLLKASVGSLKSERRFRVLVVEDNSILRNLL